MRGIDYNRSEFEAGRNRSPSIITPANPLEVSGMNKDGRIIIANPSAKGNTEYLGRGVVVVPRHHSEIRQNSPSVSGAIFVHEGMPYYMNQSPRQSTIWLPAEKDNRQGIIKTNIGKGSWFSLNSGSIIQISSGLPDLTAEEEETLWNWQNSGGQGTNHGTHHMGLTQKLMAADYFNPKNGQRNYGNVLPTYIGVTFDRTLNSVNLQFVSGTSQMRAEFRQMADERSRLQYSEVRFGQVAGLIDPTNIPDAHIAAAIQQIDSN